MFRQIPGRTKKWDDLLKQDIPVLLRGNRNKIISIAKYADGWPDEETGLFEPKNNVSKIVKKLCCVVKEILSRCTNYERHGRDLEDEICN